jgi:hypothetical protein
LRIEWLRKWSTKDHRVKACMNIDVFWKNMNHQKLLSHCWAPAKNLKVIGDIFSELSRNNLNTLLREAELPMQNFERSSEDAQAQGTSKKVVQRFDFAHRTRGEKQLVRKILLLS